LHLAIDPTPRALKFSFDLGQKARKALLQQRRGMEVRLNPGLAALNLCKFMFQRDQALLGAATDLGGKLPDVPYLGHCLSPE
jgi:hypothetical protein